MNPAKVNCIPVAWDLRHHSRKEVVQFRMKFHVIFEDQQGLISTCPGFAHGLHMAEAATVCSGRIAPVRRSLDDSTVHRIPTRDFDLRLLELCLGPCPAVLATRKIDADPVWKTGRQVELSGFIRSHYLKISSRHLPLRSNNVISTARISSLDHNSHLWSNYYGATFHSKDGLPLSHC